MRPFTDKPYRFFPPRYKPLLAWFLRLFSRCVVLPHDRLITRVDSSGGEDLARLLRGGTRVLFLPNHPTHADGQIVTEAMRQVGVKTSFMAAYDVFLRGRVRAWAMQALGGFSVDRECCDRRALRQAESTLVEGRLPLTIFPEGHVYLQNDQVTPFSEGALFIGIGAARQLAQRGVRVVAVPVAIKATYVVDLRPQLRERMEGLARSVGAEIDPAMTPREALRSIGVRALIRNLRHRGITLEEEGSLPTRIRRATELVLGSLDEKVAPPRGKDVSVMDRIRHVRRVAHEILLDPDREADHAAARLWSDEAMLAWRIASYSGDYVAGRPSIDRVAETVEKLEEDVFSRFVRPLAKRRAAVQFGEPLDLTEAVSAGRKLRNLMGELTHRAEAGVQRGLDDLNARNEELGARLWSEPLAELAAGSTT